MALLFPVTPWISRAKKHTYDLGRAEDQLLGPAFYEADPRGYNREWNEEFQSARELPRTTLQDRINRDRTIIHTYAAFVDAAVKVLCLSLSLSFSFPYPIFISILCLFSLHWICTFLHPPQYTPSPSSPQLLPACPSSLLHQAPMCVTTSLRARRRSFRGRCRR